MTIIATVKTLNAGFPNDLETLNSLGLEVGDTFEVTKVEVGRSSSSVYLKDFPGKYFNSVFFSFEEDGESLDILTDDRFYTYSSIK